jgi:hypothetical protein
MQSKTFWYDYIRKYFPRVSEYSEMVAWLEDAEDASSDLDVWGVEKAQYGFVDLALWLKNEGKGLVLEGKSKKAKGKERALNPENGKSSRKHKEKEKEGKEKGKGKEKEQEKKSKKSSESK